MWQQWFNQTRKLALFLLRRDRLRLPIWLAAITLVTIMVAASFANLYPSAPERQIMAETMKNPAMTIMVGVSQGLEDYTIGAMFAHQMLLFTAIAVAIMSILLVARHTRADEEEGRIELIRSLPVGRLAHITATIGTFMCAHVVLAICIALGLSTLGLESLDVQGSFLYGAALGATGIFFTAVTAFFAQLTESSRATIGYSFAALGVAYLLRAVGDVSYASLSWFTPLGWVQATEVYVSNVWWPIFLLVGSALLIFVGTLYFNIKRDIGSGLLPSRPGRKYASRLLQSPIGLAYRLQRTSIIAWGIGVFVLGIAYGSVFGDLEAFFVGNERLSELLAATEGASFTQQFVAMLMSIMAMICTIPPLVIVLKLWSEEKRNRTEHLLARAVSRSKLMGSYFWVAMLSGGLMLVLAAVGLWASSSAVMEDPVVLGDWLKAALVYLPAVWVMLGLAILFLGLAPQVITFIWLYLGFSFVVVYLGKLLQFPQWLSLLSPFAHIPQLPVEELNVGFVLLLTFLAGILVFIGFAGYRRRDIAG